MNHKRKGKGFTLIEMLVSIVIFMLVMLAVYAFFDQGQWLYMHSENRSNIQDLARMAVEQMERDFRMIGSNIPTGGVVNGATKFAPFVIAADPSQIGFYSDIDNGNTRLTDGTASANPVPVEYGEACNYTPAVISKDMRIWSSTTCDFVSSTSVNVSPFFTGGCPAAECFISTPERIWYRLNGDADSNGVCDTTAPPYCTLERAELHTNAPNTAVPADGDFETIATNIKSLTLSYFNMSGASLGSAPTGGALFAVHRIEINLVASDYGTTTQGSGPGTPDATQDINVRSEAMVRDARY